MPYWVKCISVIFICLALFACGGSNDDEGGNSVGKGGSPTTDEGSDNKKIWKIARQGVKQEIVDVAYTGERYLAISEEYNLTSKDDLSWSTIESSKDGVNLY